METTTYWGHIGIMENKMETTTYWGHVGIMENKMETTTYWGYIGDYLLKNWFEAWPQSHGPPSHPTIFTLNLRLFQDQQAQLKLINGGKGETGGW